MGDSGLDMSGSGSELMHYGLSESRAKKRTTTIIALCAAANFINSADRILMPIAIVPIAKEFKIGLYSQGWILSAFSIGYISSQLIGGKAAQRLGGKKVLGFAVFLWSLSTLLTPSCTRIPKLLIFMRVLLGFGEGLGVPTIFHVFAQEIPSEERSRAFGYLVSLGSLGQMLVGLVCPRIHNWRLSFHLLGCSGFLWLIFWLSLYRPKASKINYGAAGDDEEAREGLLFDVGGVAFQRSTRSNAKWIRSFLSWLKDAFDSSLKYFTNWPLWAIYIAHFSMNWSNYIVMSWLPTYLTRELAVDTKSVSFIALPYLANSVMNIFSGHFADSLVNRSARPLLSVRRLMTSIGLFGPALALLGFCAVSSFPLALFFVTLSMGLCAFNSAGHLANHVDVAPHHAGITFAISNTFATIPGITCGPFTAELVSQSGGRWFPVFVLASIINAVGAIIYLVQSGARQIIS